MNEWFEFALAALASWRVTHLLVYEDGPWDAIARLRRRAGSGFFGKLMDCFYCSSLWVSAIAAVALAPGIKRGILLWLAISAAACLLDRLRRDPVVVERIQAEEGREEDAVLRTESRAGRVGRAHENGHADSGGERLQ